MHLVIRRWIEDGHEESLLCLQLQKDKDTRSRGSRRKVRDGFDWPELGWHVRCSPQSRQPNMSGQGITIFLCTTVSLIQSECQSHCVTRWLERWLVGTSAWQVAGTHLHNTTISNIRISNTTQPFNAQYCSILTDYKPGSSFNISFYNLVDVFNIIILIIVVDLIP